jgi:hypothetical protein
MEQKQIAPHLQSWLKEEEIQPDADETWAAACRRRNPVRESPREAEPDRLEECGDAVKRKAGKFHGFPRTRVQLAHYAFYLLGFLPTQVPVAHLLATRPIQQNGSQFFAYSVGVSLSGVKSF